MICPVVASSDQAPVFTDVPRPLAVPVASMLIPVALGVHVYVHSAVAVVLGSVTPKDAHVTPVSVLFSWYSMFAFFRPAAIIPCGSVSLAF